MARLFVAVVPSEAVAERLRTIEQPDGVGVRWVPDHQWHVTLRFLGAVDREAAAAALGHVDQTRAFVELGPAVGRLGERVICLPASGLAELAASVRGLTDDLGAPPAPVPFVGHLTLGRCREDETEVAMVGLPFAARFVADRVVLVESSQNADGHHHETVAEWPLRPVGDQS